MARKKGLWALILQGQAVPAAFFNPFYTFLVATHNKSHIANATDEPWYVMAGTEDGIALVNLLSKFVANAALAVIPGAVGGETASKKLAESELDVALLARVIRFLNGVRVLGDGYSHALKGQYLAGYAGHKFTVAQATQELAAIRDMLRERARCIQPGAVREAWQTDLLNPLRYAGPGAWTAVSSVLGGDDMTLLLVNDSLDRVLYFDCNSDESWIVRRNEVVRAQYGTLRLDDPGGGLYRIPVSDTLLPGQCLLPGECLSSLNKRYDFVYQPDGNAVVYRRRGAHDDGAVWASDTEHKTAGRVAMQADGNLVVYTAQGVPVAESSTGGRNRRLVLENDGRLVMYDDDNKGWWSSGDSRMRHG